MSNSKPASRTKQRILICGILILLINIITTVTVISHMDTYTIHLPLRNRTIESIRVEIEDETVVECMGTRQDDTYMMVDLKAGAPGETMLTVEVQTEDMLSQTGQSYRVNRFGILYRTDRFNHELWHVALLGVLISLVLLDFCLISEFISRIRRDLYAYRTLQTGGMAIFVFGFSLLFLILGIYALPHYRDMVADSVFDFAQAVFELMIMGAIPFVIVFAIALSVSNIMLIRREGRRFVNILGLLLSGAIVFGVLVCLELPYALPEELRYSDVTQRVRFMTCAVFTFFLSFLLSTMICGLTAARRVPEFDQDYIIILGCGIKKDGTLYPLLRGRVDRAIWFWRAQQEATGKRAVFIPSGGKGTDEPIAEAEAMKNYLLEQGIPEECIRPEAQSLNTLQNMANSRAIIEEENKNAKAIYATTNYHVLRSGLLARQAGLQIKGIGSRTRWYFWPNAFVREFVGMMVSGARFELAFFAGLALLSYLVRLLFL